MNPHESSSSYYELNPFTPYIQSTPVSAIAFSEPRNAIYISSHTTSISKRKRHHATYSTRGGTQSTNLATFEHRASMLATHSFPDGALYSRCAAHSEAPIEVLNEISLSVYGCKVNQSINETTNKKAPPHAYCPPYGTPVAGAVQGSAYGTGEVAQMGVTTILPFNVSQFGRQDDEMLVSVSPAQVSIHSNGGMKLCENGVQGMISGVFHPMAESRTVTVGGIAWRNGKNLHCLDLYSSDMRSVASHTLNSDTSGIAVEDLATSNTKNTIIAGCTDGNLRIFDGAWRGRTMECGCIKAHGGGVAKVAMSDNLIVTTGYASRRSSGDVPCAYPDQHLMIFDIRFLGRGGVAQTSLYGPRFLSFLDKGQDGSDRILVGSGSRGVGLQIISPFSNSVSEQIQPPLDPGESITSLAVRGRDLAIGTSYGNVFPFCAAECNDVEVEQKDYLEAPSYTPDIPELSVEPHVLHKSQEKPNASHFSVFNSFVLQRDPTITTCHSGSDKADLNARLNISSKRLLSKKLANEIAGNDSYDECTTIPTDNLGYDSCLDKKGGNNGKTSNFNKFIVGNKIQGLVYDVNSDPRKKEKRHKGTTNDHQIPVRYKCKFRPPNSIFSVHDVAKFNNTIYPGWDYPPSSPNAYVVSALCLLCYTPDVSTRIMGQYQTLNEEYRSTDSTKRRKNTSKKKSLLGELASLFDQISCITEAAACYPKTMIGENVHRVVSTFTPTNFIASFSTLPEAEALALLDGTASAVDISKRLEHFFRFLLHRLDVEDTTGESSFFDQKYAHSSVKVNKFASTGLDRSISSTRSYTLELSYDKFINHRIEERSVTPTFGDVLLHSLSHSRNIRAFNKASESFEAVEQRKVVTSLPSTLAISCSCAADEEKLSIWRGKEKFLPEFIEIEMNDSDITVRQLVGDEWIVIEGVSLPDSVTGVIHDFNSKRPRKYCVRYRLEAVISFIRDENIERGYDGHHVLHQRIAQSKTKQILLNQIAKATTCMNLESKHLMTQISNVTVDDFKSRIGKVQDDLRLYDEGENHDWVLFNGINVSTSSVDDARSFGSYREPCIIIFHQADTDPIDLPVPSTTKAIPSSIMKAPSLTSTASLLRTQDDIPGKGDLISFDAEFVQVENEESKLSASGSKIILREGRNALARMSLISCRTGEVILDAHVVPLQPVVDYLTRFSGIRPSDLTNDSSHYLIPARIAFLQLRFLVQRGCIFVGHGLNQDFATANIFVPPSQIIDTVQIYNIDNRRYISLRFLVNFLLKRDMQQDVHDSIEDARAAYELYLKALILKKEGRFEAVLHEIYAYGEGNDWKVGIGEER